jgi:hypothetical protein
LPTLSLINLKTLNFGHFYIFHYDIYYTTSFFQKKLSVVYQIISENLYYSLNYEISPWPITWQCAIYTNDINLADSRANLLIEGLVNYYGSSVSEKYDNENKEAGKI